MGGCFQDKNKDTSFPDREDSTRYRTPGPGMVSLTKAPVTYNSTLDVTVGGNLGIFSSSPTPFVSGAAPPHPLSLSDKPRACSKTFGSLCSPGVRRLRFYTRASSTQPFVFFSCSGFSAASGVEGGAEQTGCGRLLKLSCWRRVFPDQERGN